MTLPRVQTPLSGPGAVGTAMSTRRPPPSTSTTKPGAGRNVVPRYGMTMWFQVIVTDPGGTNQDLGRWSGCSGLSVNLDSEEVWSGGDYHAPFLVPKAISYGKVTLERAMDHESAAELRRWLQRVADEWIASDEGGAAMVANPSGGTTAEKKGFHGTTVTIRLFCSLLDPAGPGAAGRRAASTAATADGGEPAREVTSWVLRNAIPQSWQGPALTAKSGDVAIEKLVLNHRGFLAPSHGGGTGGTQVSQGQGRLTLSTADGAQTVDFQYNPVSVGLERTNDLDPGKPVTRVESDNQVKEYGKLNITLSELHIEGVQAIKEKWQTLLGWTEPVPGASKTAAGGDKPTETARELHIRMGAGDGATLDEKVWIKQVKISYKRFTPTGVPSRASVTLTVVVLAKTTGAQTGAPGPKTHVVTGNESLAQVTAKSGGEPADWRGTAEKNNCDNPFALPSGSVLVV
jgi:phage tail-like protein